jgi:hypothetical protein
MRQLEAIRTDASWLERPGRFPSSLRLRSAELPLNRVGPAMQPVVGGYESPQSQSRTIAEAAS